MRKKIIILISVLIIILIGIINGCSKTSEPTETKVTVTATYTYTPTYLLSSTPTSTMTSTLTYTPTIGLKWVRLLGSGENDYGYGIATDSNGDVYVTGNIRGSIDGQQYAGDDDILICKYDSNGDKQWTRLLGSVYYDEGGGIATDSNGNVYVTGNIRGSIDGQQYAGGDDIVIVKYNSNGDKIWTRLLGGTEYDHGKGIATDSNGNVYVTGFTSGSIDGQQNSGGLDIVIAKYNSNGDKIWTRLLGSGSNGSDRGYGIATDSNGNVYVTGYTNGSIDGEQNAGSDDIVIAKYDSNGDKIWTRLLGSINYDYGNGIATDSNGNVYVTGYTNGSIDGQPNAGGWDIVIAKYDSNGDKKWTKLFGSAYDDSGNGIATDSNENVYVTGYTNGSIDGQPNAGGYDIIIVKYDSNGNKIWTRLFGGGSYDRGYGISIDSGENVYVTGYTEGSIYEQQNAGSTDIFIIKF